MNEETCTTCEWDIDGECGLSPNKCEYKYKRGSRMVSDEVLENAIECYKTTRISALDEVVYECLLELQKLRNLIENE